MNAEDLNTDRKGFLGRGWAMPVAIEPRTGRVASVQHEEDIRQSIRIILETSPGERVMRPNFGCGIHEMVFDAIDSTATAATTASQMRRYRGKRQRACQGVMALRGQSCCLANT